MEIIANKITRKLAPTLAALTIGAHVAQAEETLGKHALKDAILNAIDQATVTQGNTATKGVLVVSSQDTGTADHKVRSLRSLLDALATYTGSKSCTLTVSFYNGQSPFNGKADIFSKLGKRASIAHLKAKLNAAEPIFKQNIDMAGASAKYSYLGCYNNYQVTLSRQINIVKVGDTAYHSLKLGK